MTSTTSPATAASNSPAPVFPDAASPDPALADPAPEGLAFTAGPVGLIGDVHGDLEWFSHVLDRLADAGASRFIQLGDFQQFSQDPAEFFEAAAERVALLAERVEDRLELVFIGGNHDNLPYLRSLPEESTSMFTLASGLPAAVLFADRGGRWSFDDVEFVALGGAATFRTEPRTEGVDWWPDLEVLSAADVEAVAAGGPADVVVSHEAPASVSFPGEKPFPRGAETRQRIEAAAAAVDADLLVHGHLHRRLSGSVELPDGRALSTEGLSRSTKPCGDGALLLDTATLETRQLPECTSPPSAGCILL